MKTNELKKEISELKTLCASHDRQLRMLATAMNEINEGVQHLNMAHLSICNEIRNIPNFKDLH